MFGLKLLRVRVVNTEENMGLSRFSVIIFSDFSVSVTFYNKVH